MTLKTGDTAPDFTLPVTDGGNLTLSSLRGKKVVLFFYPKDNTSGCSLESQNFDALKQEFAVCGTAVVGLSPDSIKSHQCFQKDKGLTVSLVSDENLDTLKAYGVWKEKHMAGRSYMGVERTTMLIDGEGIIRRIWPKVKVIGHAGEVLEAARTLA
ncbi:MAG: peroxiredoxin [Methylobacteriaceae bacterium]|jgi:peroxiredoxin Q/BCP|nr:peroxiredoxin [Methylobacteriaceae bacterium]